MADKPVESYYETLEGQPAEVAAALRALVKEITPQATEALKWGQPTFEDHGLLCYIRATKKYVNFGFFKGGALDDPQGLLEGTGQKMRHVKLPSVEILREREKDLKTLLEAALQLNRGQ